MRAPRIRTRTGVTAGIAAATLLLAACGSSGGGTSAAAGGDTLSSMAKLSASQLQSKAEQEGQVNWYTTFAADDVNDMVAAFNKTYPKIKVNALRLSADQLPPRVITEQKGNEFNADVVSGDAPQVDQLINANALQPYCPPDQQPLPAGQTLPKGYCGNVYVVTTVIVYNPKALQRLGLQPPKTFEDLTQPQWKGHFSMDPSAVNLYESLINTMGHDKAQSLLQRLGANQPKLVESHTLALTQVEAGEPPASASAYGYKSASEERKDPSKIAFVNPEPLPTSFTPVDVARNAPHPAAAALLINWITSQEGQQAVIDVTNHTSLRTDVKNDPTVWDPQKFTPAYGSASLSSAKYNQYASEMKQALGAA
ncbi:MAG TPA: extracellular solute-binding protein [Pseudonocardiaceae bacterium]|jgi:iron(III) transport system substrate-binding protein|nr:extracellular solute-binding protein [Pseudonocardiaceae bacterium]